MILINAINYFLNKKKLKQIKLVILDVDGVLTNGQIIISSNGIESKIFNVKDGLGIKILQKSGVEVCIISGGEAESAKIRADKLGIKNYIFNSRNKLKAINLLQKKLNKSKKETLFLGDDINDQIVKPNVNLLLATKDASQSLKNKSHIILNNKGGEGAVRELAEEILKSKNLWHHFKTNGWKEKN
tara:strand:+ start:40766 stop:41323 length:558 start_codon:yes stop_codon:yes gene_type:complete